MKFTLAQLNPTVGALEQNAQQILAAAAEAQTQGAQVLLTPELSLCGYPPRDLLLQPSFIAAMDGMLQQLSQELPPELWVLVGTVSENGRSLQVGGKSLFNSSALLQGGKIQQVFHKRLLPTYDVFDEHRYFEPGPGEQHTFSVADASGSSIKIGVTICEDLWNDEEFWGKRSYAANPIADLAQQEVDVIVNLSASPYSLDKQRLRETMLQHLAQRYKQPILYVNQVGGNDDLVFDGGSFGVDRQGSVICRAPSFETALVTTTLELKTVDSEATALDTPHTKAASLAPLPQCESEELWQALVLGVRDYASKCGFSTAVLGLSGGIDSALVAAIAAAALGPKNVLGILMPSPYSSDHSITDAKALAHTIGIPIETLPIQPAMTAFDQSLKPLFEGTEFGVAEENLQSRIRGTLLMAVANKFGHLLITTGNKSEMAVGYCTLYGDMNGGLAAIADVPKTKVFELCRWLNTQPSPDILQLSVAAPEIIPTNIITKPPSAELKPGQVDQDSLPPYEILDDILDRLICQHQAAQDVITAGFDCDTVKRVLSLINRSEFKRKQAAPGIKVTDRAFGTGWRMPIAKRWYS